MSIRMKPIRALAIIKNYERTRPSYGFAYMSDDEKDKAYEYRKAVETIHTVIDRFNQCKNCS